MNTPHSRLFFIITLSLLFWGNLEAQTPEPNPPARTFRIISVVGNYEGLQYETTSAKTSARPIAVSRSLSSPQPAPTGTKLELFRMLPPPPDAPPGTPPTRQVVLTATLDTKAPESIVVALPLIPADKLTAFKAHTIPLSENYRAGTCLIANLSGFPQLAVSMKENVSTVKNGAVNMTTFDKGHNSIKIALQNGDKWTVAGNDAWRLHESYRGYILTLPYMEDPDFPPPNNPPPVLIRINFEISPEMIKATTASVR